MRANQTMKNFMVTSKVTTSNNLANATLLNHNLPSIITKSKKSSNAVSPD